MINHTVYLSNTSGVKVGITRKHQQVTRWIDQGATQAIPVLTVKRRKDAGLIEVELAKDLADKTNWRNMLKGISGDINLAALRTKTLEKLAGKYDFEPANDEIFNFTYPIEKHPEKVKSYNLEKTPEFTDVLKGIKGQYLIFADGVINLRKWQGYQVEFSFS